MSINRPGWWPDWSELLNSDPEWYCSRCYAGVDSPEHHEKCVATGHAKDGESA